ncbi:hypothetical protein CK203_072750 [Vitis vinifera]|uniref:Uncharacterized protein n=1 Tax=Vitis vinifera TaxID=29760 RepID=A0A438F016_VITVI|nr:hypothetical protein CK203_072750 [Vitis vinifera]
MELNKPFWQVVNYSDSRGRGVVGENPCSPGLSLWTNWVSANWVESEFPAIGNIKATPPGGAFQHPAATASHCLAGRPGEPITDSQSRSQQGADLVRPQGGACIIPH